MRLEITNADDLNSIIQEMFNEFCDSFHGNNNLLREAKVDEFESIEECVLILTDFGEYLVDKYIDRMFKVFSKYFDKDDFDITEYFHDIY